MNPGVGEFGGYCLNVESGKSATCLLSVKAAEIFSLFDKEADQYFFKCRS